MRGCHCAISRIHVLVCVGRCVWFCVYVMKVCRYMLIICMCYCTNEIYICDKMHLNMYSAICEPFCPGLNVLIYTSPFQRVQSDLQEHHSDLGARRCGAQGHSKDTGVGVADLPTAVLLPSVRAGCVDRGSVGLSHHCWMCESFNSLWPSETIWRHKSGSLLAQVMACCLTAPSHYLNQCWLIISKVPWHSSECNFTRDKSF